MNHHAARVLTVQPGRHGRADHVGCRLAFAVELVNEMPGPEFHQLVKRGRLWSRVQAAGCIAHLAASRLKQGGRCGEARSSRLRDSKIRSRRRRRLDSLRFLASAALTSEE